MKVNLDINNRDKIEVGDIVLYNNKKCLVIFKWLITEIPLALDYGMNGQKG